MVKSVNERLYANSLSAAKTNSDGTPRLSPQRPGCEFRRWRRPLRYSKMILSFVFRMIAATASTAYRKPFPISRTKFFTCTYLCTLFWRRVDM